VAAVTKWFEDLEIDDPEKVAWALNEHRRHAPEGVRALAAARRANMRQGERTDLTAVAVTSQAEAAAQFGVSVDSLQRAKTVLNHGSPALVEAVESGDVAVSLAAKVLRRIEGASRSPVSPISRRRCARSTAKSTRRQMSQLPS
jgi:ABC-type transporter Mla subunit MlaD